MTIASAIITGTWMTRMSSVFFSALKKAGSPISRPQLKPGANRHGTVRVAWKEIRNELMIGQTQKIGEDQQIGREERDRPSALLSAHRCLLLRISSEWSAALAGGRMPGSIEPARLRHSGGYCCDRQAGRRGDLVGGIVERRLGVGIAAAEIFGLHRAHDDFGIALERRAAARHDLGQGGEDVLPHRLAAPIGQALR